MNPISCLPLILGELGASTALRVAHQDAQAGHAAKPNDLATTCSGTQPLQEH